MRATILATTFDCHDPLRVAQFWATALGHAIDDSNAPDSVQVSEPGSMGRMYFEKVPKAKTVKNRVHLDLTSDLSWRAEVERLTAAGARSVATHRDPDDFNNPYEWTVMQDPEGNEFCSGQPRLARA